MQINKLAVAKKIATIVVGIGTNRIATAIIKNNVETETVIQKVTVESAGVVIGMMASEATKEFTATKIDEIVEVFQMVKTKLADAKAEAKQEQQ